jgi:hypothetical protein
MATAIRRLRLASLATVLVLACGAFVIQSVAVATQAHAQFPVGTFSIKSIGKVDTCAQDVSTTKGRGEVRLLPCAKRSDQSWEAIGGARVRNLITERCVTVENRGANSTVVTDKSCGNGFLWQWRYDNTATHTHIVGPGQLCWKSRDSGVTIVMKTCSSLNAFEDWLVTVS